MNKVTLLLAFLFWLGTLPVLNMIAGKEVKGEKGKEVTREIKIAYCILHGLHTRLGIRPHSSLERSEDPNYWPHDPSFCLICQGYKSDQARS